jgi:hypothetical protein
MENIERPAKVSKAQKQEMTAKNQQIYDQDQFTKIYDYLDALNGETKFNIDLVYPVGSIYMSVNNTNPADLFGGEWEQLKDRFLIGAGGSYSGTGGQATINLQHNHKLRTNIAKNSGNGNGIAYTAGAPIFENNNSEAVQNALSSSQSIIPPYLAVYMWKRIN